MELNTLLGLLITTLMALAGYGLRNMKSDIDAALKRIEATQTVDGVKLDAMAEEVRLLRVRLHENSILPWAM